jgi:uncharacterized protein YbjT (DUF2867 family)
MIVITAPTGQIGHRVLNELLARDEEVRVVVRDAARLPADVRTRVEVVEGSHRDRAVVEAAFREGDAVFWLVPPDPRAPSADAAYVDFTRPAAEVFARGEVDRVVGVSALGRGTPVANRAGHVTASLRMDDLIAGTGVAYRALLMPSFMDNVLRQVELIRTQGVFFWPTTDGHHRWPICATRDVAAVAVDLLVDRSWDGTGAVPVLGPEDVSLEDMAAVMSDVLDKPVRFEPTPFDEFGRQLVERGMSEAMAQSTVDMLRAKDEGLDGGVERTAQSATRTTFRQWCEEVLAPALLARPAAQSSFGGPPNPISLPSSSR